MKTRKKMYLTNSYELFDQLTLILAHCHFFASKVAGTLQALWG